MLSIAADRITRTETALQFASLKRTTREVHSLNYASAAQRDEHRTHQFSDGAYLETASTLLASFKDKGIGGPEFQSCRAHKATSPPRSHWPAMLGVNPSPAATLLSNDAASARFDKGEKVHHMRA